MIYIQFIIMIKNYSYLIILVQKLIRIIIIIRLIYVVFLNFGLLKIKPLIIYMKTNLKEYFLYYLIFDIYLIHYNYI